MRLRNLISVAVFAFLGGCLRQLLSVHWSTAGILTANLSGCFLLAFLTYYVFARDLLAEWLNVGMGTGLIGALTTFSSLAVGIIKLAQANYWAALTYGVTSMLGGLLMAWLGFISAKKLAKRREQRD
jgi:CrcB protein